MINKLFILAVTERCGFSYATDLGIPSSSVSIITDSNQIPSEDILVLISPYTEDGLGLLISNVSKYSNANLVYSHQVELLTANIMNRILKAVKYYQSNGGSLEVAINQNLFDIDPNHKIQIRCIWDGVGMRFIPDNTFSFGLLQLLRKKLASMNL